MGNKLGCLPNKSSVESVHGRQSDATNSDVQNTMWEQPPDREHGNGTNASSIVASNSGNGEEQIPERNPPVPQSTDLPETSDAFIRRFNDIEAENDIDSLIRLIEKLLKRKTSVEQNNLVHDNTSSQESNQVEEERLRRTFAYGPKFLLYIKDSVEKNFHDGVKSLAEMFQEIAKVNSILGWLSIIGYILTISEKGIDNKNECLKLLKNMVNLAKQVRKLKNRIEEDKFNEANKLIVKGAITCFSLLKSHFLSRTLMASAKSEALKSVRADIIYLTADLTLDVVTDTNEQVQRHMPLRKPEYPNDAVGIERPVKKIIGWLEARENPLLAVVIYGFGGIGKSTVAKAVAAQMNLDGYNYATVYIDQEQVNNDFTRLQQHILKYCFPTYNSGILGHCEQGREELKRAFDCEENNKPIFLYIDNVARSYDLTQLLPPDLGRLPRGSRILVTTRRLTATDMFQQDHLVRIDYPLSPLHRKDAVNILFKNPTERGDMGEEYLERILQICDGVPLVLKHVGLELQKNRRCDRLLDALETGENINGEQLSDNLFNFVFNNLNQYSREAFLDICCFFMNNWKLEDVKYIVGADAATPLLEAGLITSTAKQDAGTMNFEGENLIVPDIIAAMGRRLGKDNRITNYKSFSKAADEEKLGEIRGLWLTDDISDHPIEEDDLNKMDKSLRVLALGDGIRVNGTSREKFEELSFLHIGGSNTQLPMKVEALNKLTVFHGPLFDEGKVTLSKLPSRILAVKLMEHAGGIESEFSEMEGCLQCYQLEKLHFIGLRRKLVEGVISLHTLKTFILDDFSKIESLPEQIRVELLGKIFQLRFLSVLCISNSSYLKYLPASFGQLSALKQLRLSNFVALKELPSTFNQFSALTHLDLEGCCALKVVPSNFEELTALTHLSLSGCKSLEILPSNFGHLTALKYLNLSFCEKLPTLPPTFGRLSALKRLCLKHCTMLTTLPQSFRELSALEYLNLCYCAQLGALSFALEELTALYRLECCPQVKEKIKNQIKEEVLIVVD